MEAKPARQDEDAETPIMEDTVIAHTPLEAGDNGSGSQRNREDAARTQDTSSDVPSLLDTKLWDEHPVYNPPLSASIREPLGPDLQPYAHTSGPASYTSRYPTVCHHAPHHAHNDDDHHHPRYTGGMEGPVSGDPSMASTSRLTLADFRRSEGPALRAQKLHALWRSLPTLPEPSERPTPTQMVKLPGQDTIGILSPERAERLSRLYLEELSRRVNMQERPEARLWGGADDLTEPEQQQQQQQAQQQQQQQQQKKSGKGIAWKDFRKFLWDQEKELWDIFHDLDRDGDGKLDVAEMRNALQRSGIEMTDSGLRDFVSFLASGATTPPSTQQQRKDATYITFAEFRDFLILLPRKASVQEIYKCTCLCNIGGSCRSPAAPLQFIRSRRGSRMAEEQLALIWMATSASAFPSRQHPTRIPPARRPHQVPSRRKNWPIVAKVKRPWSMATKTAHPADDLLLIIRIKSYKRKTKTRRITWSSIGTSHGSFSSRAVLPGQVRQIADRPRRSWLIVGHLAQYREPPRHHSID